MNRSDEDELNHTKKLIDNNISNYSAWHNRRYEYCFVIRCNFSEIALVTKLKLELITDSSCKQSNFNFITLGYWCLYENVAHW